LANRVVTVARSEPIPGLVIEIIVSLLAGFNVRAINTRSICVALPEDRSVAA
jgi:hypothetical protein